MDKIIGEALDYVTPKEDKEPVAVDPKAKGKKPAEQVTTDPFEGRDSAAFKNLAQQLKEKYLQGPQLPAVDLVELVLDDQLLVSLFVERIKLAFAVDRETSDLKAGVKREREILLQIEEIEA